MEIITERICVKEFVISDATESVTTDSQEVVGKLSR